MRDFIDSAEVAALMGLSSADAFLIRRRKLEADHGFPIPQPHWRRPLKYRRDQIEAWLDDQGRPRLPGEPDIAPELLASGKVALLAEARRP